MPANRILDRVNGAADIRALSYEQLEELAAEIRAYRRREARRAVRLRIRSLERLHATIVDQFPAALAVLDADGRAVTVNPAFELAFSTTAPEGKTLGEILPADLIESAVRDAYRRDTVVCVPDCYRRDTAVSAQVVCNRKTCCVVARAVDPQS